MVILSLDGNCACALLGENLQEGEAEFVEVTEADMAKNGEDAMRFPKTIHKAALLAYERLLERLGRDPYSLPYQWSY